MVKMFEVTEKHDRSVRGLSGSSFFPSDFDTLCLTPATLLHWKMAINGEDLEEIIQKANNLNVGMSGEGLDYSALAAEEEEKDWGGASKGVSEGYTSVVGRVIAK